MFTMNPVDAMKYRIGIAGTAFLYEGLVPLIILFNISLQNTFSGGVDHSIRRRISLLVSAAETA
jgi:hypothetical protein